MPMFCQMMCILLLATPGIAELLLSRVVGGNAFCVVREVG